MVVGGVLLGRHFAHGHAGIEHAEDQDRRAAVERIDHRVGNHPFGSDVADADPGKEVGEEIAHQRTGVAEHALDRVGLRLLLLVHHVAHHHLEGLHSHVDRGVEQHEHHQPERHRHLDRKTQAARVGQKGHHQHGDQRAEVEIGLATSPAAPGLVAEAADQRLYDHAHERGQDPEETQIVRIGPERGEDTADIRTLEGVGDLNTEKSEAQIPHLPKR